MRRYVLMFSVVALAGCGGTGPGTEGRLASRWGVGEVLCYPDVRGVLPEPVPVSAGTRARLVAESAGSPRRGRWVAEMLDGPHKGERLVVPDGEFVRR